MEKSFNKHVIWVVGDSTLSAFKDNYYYPRYGYGTQLGNFFDNNKYEVRNIALSGRSSKSYLQDPEYKILRENMKVEDYLLIGFGHNDEKDEPARFTNANGNYKDEGSFANSLYENYIKYAEEKGCRVILCTPIVRRTEEGKWSDINLHITTTIGDYEGGDYPQAIRNLGADLNIPVIDMTRLTKKLYDDLGPAETVNLHARTAPSLLTVDNTHTNIWGGTYNAYFAAKEIKKMNLGSISEAVLDDKIAHAPSKKDVLVFNAKYLERDYDADLKESTLWEDAGIWKGTVFGNIGGSPSKDDFSLSKIDNDSVNIAVKNSKGKIANTADGIAMYYYKVPVESRFTLTATADINSISYNSMVSFGLMARDEMYIDKCSTDPLGDYVAAGPLNISEEDKWNCFARKSGALIKGSIIKNTSINSGDSFDLRIESNSDGYACTFGDKETITGGFDFALTAIDHQYVYVGMFAARDIDVTFRNIKLVVDGEYIQF